MDSVIDLSVKFVSLTKELLGERKGSQVLKSVTAEMPKALGMSFKIPSMSVEPVYYPPEVLFDLAGIASSLSSKNPSIASKFEEIKKEAEGAIEESSLVSRYADYQDAIMGMSTATEIIKDVSEKIAAELQGPENKGWVDQVKAVLNQMKELVETAFRRVFGGLESLYNGLIAFKNHFKELTTNIGTKAKEKIIAGLHRIVQSLAALSVRIISTFFAWLSSVKKIASDHGFKLSEITIKLNPISIEKVSVLGFSIPIPKIQMPEVSMKFGPS